MALPPEKEKEKESQQSTDLREKPIEEMVFYPPRGNGRLLLPLSLTKDGPIYVNAKQYHGILRRRQSRAKEKLKNKGIKNRKRHTSTQPSPIEKHSSCDSHSSNCDTRAIWSPIRDSCPRYAGMQPLVVEKRSNCNSNCPVRDSCPSDTSTQKSLIEKCSNSNSNSLICDSFPKQQQLRDHLQSIEDKERCNGNASIVEGSLIVKEEGNLQQELCDDLHRVEESFLAMDGSSIIKEEGDLVPYVGMEFKSPEEAHKFYVSYAMRVGFNTKVRNSHNKIIVGSKQLMLMSLSCDREGFKWDSREPVKKPRPHYRTGCKAEMRIKRIVRDVPAWVCHYVVLEHNHDLLPFMFHKNIGTSRTAKVIQMLAEEAGGFEKLTFRHMEVEKEVKCFIDLYERMNVKGDGNAIQKHFSERLSKNPSFFYQMDIGKSGHLMNVFWVDGKCRASYSYFGDVVTFDTTYLTGKYDMPIAVFLGVNHHGQRICLGCGMLANETTETFVWLFKAWLKAMGQPPMSITTDQCPAIQEAIEVVFPEVHYRLSLWHIMKKQTVKFGEMENKEEVMSTMSKCVYDSFKVEDFEREWKDMIKTYDLERNEWLQSLYEIRELWVPAYQRGTIFTGLQATLQSESIDHFFDGFVHQKTTLSEFIEQYDRVLQEHYQKEIDADFADFHSIPILRMHHSFEVQGASFYTEEIFQKFQTQILKMDNCVIAVKDVHGAITMYVVTDTITKENGPVEQKGYKLTFDAWEAKVSCICCLFEFQGILCNHAMSVLYANGITQIPSHYMLQRWRKDFKRTHAIYSDCERDQVNQAMDRCNDLWRRCIQFANEAAVTTERYLFAVQVLAEATNKIRHMDRYFNAGKTIDPKQAKRRGRPPKQHLEAIRDEMTTETCGLCQKTGHTAATCHEIAVISTTRKRAFWNEETILYQASISKLLVYFVDISVHVEQWQCYRMYIGRF